MTLVMMIWLGRLFLRHEEKRLRLIAEKNRLIEEERKRLEKTKNNQDDLINQIKNIFSACEPSSRGSRGPPQAVIQPYRPRYATHMPGKLLNTEIVTLDDSDGENSNDTTGIVLNQDEDIVDSPLKIEKVFCAE